MSSKKPITQEDLGRLHHLEVELIYLIRSEYRYGTVEIYTRDGLPTDILQTVKRHRLGKNGLSTPE